MRYFFQSKLDRRVSILNLHSEMNKFIPSSDYFEVQQKFSPHVFHTKIFLRIFIIKNNLQISNTFRRKIKMAIIQIMY